MRALSQLPAACGQSQAYLHSIPASAIVISWIPPALKATYTPRVHRAQSDLPAGRVLLVGASQERAPEALFRKREQHATIAPRESGSCNCVVNLRRLHSSLVGDANVNQPLWTAVQRTSRSESFLASTPKRPGNTEACQDAVAGLCQVTKEMRPLCFRRPDCIRFRS